MNDVVVQRTSQFRQRLQLGQLRPADTNAASVYAPADGVQAKVAQIIICNTTGGAAAYRIFHDDDGSTYDQTTALFYDVSLAANTSEVLDMEIEMTASGGNLAVRTDTNDALTFTVYGEETQVRVR